MHIDLNSAFASAEQQAHPSLRGKAIGVTNRISKYCCVIAASYEAKAKGIRVGMRLDEAQKIIPDFIMLETDPPKYHHVYETLANIMQSYSPNVQMKSIDEGIIDFKGTANLHHASIENIGYEIKKKVAQELGHYMKVNIGIGTNRFLAKTAANLHKPDGLDIIDYQNLESVYSSLKLTDLTGIARHFEARLNAANIFTPLDFLNTPKDTLRKLVFHSLVGEDWYLRLRGFEIDDTVTKLGTVGRQYALDISSTDDDILLPRFHYLCETVGKKLRFNCVDAQGIIVWLNHQNHANWYMRKMFKSVFFSDKDIYQKALCLFNQRPRGLIVKTMGISCYALKPSTRDQISLFDNINKQERLTKAIDNLNGRFGNFVIGSANAKIGNKIVKQKVPFGGTKYFELLLKSNYQKHPD